MSVIFKNSHLSCTEKEKKKGPIGLSNKKPKKQNQYKTI